MARDINRIEPFMQELTKIWKEYAPDWRFTQLIENIWESLSEENIPFYMEDDKLLDKIKKYFYEERNIDCEKAKKNLKEIVKLSEKEIENNDENVHAILDLEDLKSLKIILDNIEK